MPTYKNSKHISTKKLAYRGLDLAYKTDDLNIYKLIASKDNEELTDSGWAILTASCDNISPAKYGYKAVAFINKKTKAVHIASADTKFNIYDLLHDLLITLHYLPAKLTPLQDFVIEIINKLGGLSKATVYSFITSGHSLEAIIADLTLVEIHSRNLHFNKSVTFDSPGSKPIIERGIEKKIIYPKCNNSNRRDLRYIRQNIFLLILLISILEKQQWYSRVKKTALSQSEE